MQYLALFKHEGEAQGLKAINPPLVDITPCLTSHPCIVYGAIPPTSYDSDSVARCPMGMYPDLSGGNIHEMASEEIGHTIAEF